MSNLMQVDWLNKCTQKLTNARWCSVSCHPCLPHIHHLVTVCMASVSIYFFFTLITSFSFMFITWHYSVLFSSFRLPSFRIQKLLWWFVSRACSAGAEPSQRGNWWQSLVTWRPQNVGELRPLWALSPQPDGLPRHTSAEVVGAAEVQRADEAVDLLLW